MLATVMPIASKHSSIQLSTTELLRCSDKPTRLLLDGLQLSEGVVLVVQLSVDERWDRLQARNVIGWSKACFQYVAHSATLQTHVAIATACAEILETLKTRKIRKTRS